MLACVCLRRFRFNTEPLPESPTHWSRAHARLLCREQDGLSTTDGTQITGTYLSARTNSAKGLPSLLTPIASAA